MSNFAEKHMQKHGWSKGKGLGREESGISEPIKVKIKQDSSGIGHDPAEHFTNHWWEVAFKNASANICVSEGKEGIKVDAIEESKSVTVKKSRCKKITAKEMLYGKFIKSGTLTNGIIQKSPDTSLSSDESCSEDNIQIKVLTDEELLKVCGGRTGHKGARHGLNQSGKLARLAQHELLHISQENQIYQKTKLSKTGVKILGNDNKKTSKNIKDSESVFQKTIISTQTIRKINKHKKKKRKLDSCEESLMHNEVDIKIKSKKKKLKK